jgi:predicted AlkP superfamily pyrophosphatase or phosphodiesterase
MTKLLLIILDGVPYRNWRRLFGNLEGWVASGEARVRRMRSVLPSTSGSCYASIHTGLPPQEHRIWDNSGIRRLEFPDVFSELTRAGKVTGAVTHSFWSEFFNRAPFDVVRDIEYDEPGGPITHGRFHTMHGDSGYNQMTPADYDLFGTLTRLCEVKSIDYGVLHACYRMDGTLAPFIHRWRCAGYEVIVTADHGQDARGHHGGTGEDQRDFAFYYFGNSPLPPEDEVLEQLALAPSILTRMGVPVPNTMKVKPFFGA